jgi:hypothetical protein
MSPEERLLALERRVYRLPVLDLERRAVALEQGLAQSWSWGVGYQTPTPTPTPTDATIVVQCWAEGGVPLSGVPVDVDGGAHTGNTDASGRFTVTGLTPSTSYRVFTSASSKTNYDGTITYPLGTTTLNLLIWSTATDPSLIDSVYGAETLAPSGIGWQTPPPIPTRNVAACGSCAAATGVPFSYRLDYANPSLIAPQLLTTGTNTYELLMIVRPRYQGNVSTLCPTSTFNPTLLMNADKFPLTSRTYAGGLSLTFTHAAGTAIPLYCTGAATITVTQP